jgi:hypothetical protein
MNASGAAAVPQEKWPPDGGHNLLILKNER